MTTCAPSNTSLYRRWQAMLQRCNNPNSPGYAYYGGRDIGVCGAWRRFAAFASWARRSGYAPYLSLDRADNDGDYKPENCRWVQQTVQMRNQRRLRINNTSGYRGVTQAGGSGRPWRARIWVDSREIHLGRFIAAREAAEEYDAYVIGEGLEHTLNFPRGSL